MKDVVEKEEEKKKAGDMERQAKRELQLRKQMLQRQQETFQQKNEELKVLHQLAKDLNHQLNEQTAKTAHTKKTLEKDMELQLTQKESSQPEKLLKDQREKQRKEEVRVHEESKKFLQNQHEELQRQLLQWQQYTNQMLQEKVQQLNSVCCKRTVNADKLLEMRRKFREMEQVVMEDREEKEKLRKQQDEARAATKLQAWWRGCMVRRGLGMYKKTDESKKGKKKKEGKKKKKK
uniref:Dynein regulatory complex protein 9 n=2 Tax=Mastacembelus armatus TaxID=205130 RepID=A0A7N8WW04_9TELE